MVCLRVLRVACCVLAGLVAGCSLATCESVPVTVAQKEERERLEMVSRGLRTSPTGTVEELRVPEVVREYWVRGQDGTWYRILADRFRAMEVGDSVELCR